MTSKIARNPTTIVNDDGRPANLGLFRPVDGANDNFTDSAQAEIGPLAAGRVWVKVLGGIGHVRIGAEPTAATSDMPLSDGDDYYFDVLDGDIIAVLGASGESGVLHVATEVAIPA